MSYLSEKSKSDILSTKKLSECCSFGNPNNNENDLHHSQRIVEESLNNKIISNKSLAGTNDSKINNIGEINDEIYANEAFLHNINNYAPIIPRISFVLDEDTNDLINYRNINSSSFMKSEKTEKKPILSQKNTGCKSFSNLSETKEKSFQVNSSYDNINRISHNKYIKDFDLQSKTKDFIIKETSNINKSGMKNALLRLSIVSNPINDIDSNEYKSNIKLSDNELEISKINRMKRFKTRKSDNNNNNNNNNNKNIYTNKNKTKKSLSVTKLAEIKKKNKPSSQTIINSKILDFTNINATPKPKKRSINKKNQNMNKKLNTISKNIKRAN